MYSGRCKLIFTVEEREIIHYTNTMVTKKVYAIIIYQRKDINSIIKQYTSTCSESVDVGQTGCTEANFIVPDWGI